MTLHDRTLRRIERLENKAYCLIAKWASKQRNPAPDQYRGRVKGTPASVLRAEKLCRQAIRLRLALELRETARERERELRQAREAEREVPRSMAGGAQ